jgi:hypothetical protein
MFLHGDIIEIVPNSDMLLHQVIKGKLATCYLRSFFLFLFLYFFFP